MKRVLAVLLVLATACTGGSTSSGAQLSETAVRFRILDALHGDISYCGPPVAIAPTLPGLRQEFVSIRRQHALYRAIVRHEGFEPSVASQQDLTRIIRVFHQIEAIDLRHVSGVYAFQVWTSGTGSGFDRLVGGVVDGTGSVDVQRTTLGRQNCPICLARGVRIATPAGPVPVTRIRVGMAVWSTDRAGRRIRAVVLDTRRVRATGELLRVTLMDGRAVVVSPGHPTARGLLVGELAVGDPLSGSAVAAINAVRYQGFTYDLLPSGPTHTYFADGVLLESTLAGSGGGPAA
jgi:hypothetical protein